MAVVELYPDGATEPGWSLTRKNSLKGAFMDKYERGQFKLDRMTRVDGTVKPYAIIMRSMRMVCIDVDGKNGGWNNLPMLGPLPRTIAELSKSGDGMHLFYYTPEDSWDQEFGYARHADRINFAPGIDIRAVGCVYHHPHQKWHTNRHMANLPLYLDRQLVALKDQAVLAATTLSQSLTTMDPEDLLMAQQAKIEDLFQPIPNGQRNNRLFAIGAQLRQLEVKDWAAKVYEAATKTHGLDSAEANKLVANISKYGDNAVTP